MTHSVEHPVAFENDGFGNSMNLTIGYVIITHTAEHPVAFENDRFGNSRNLTLGYLIVTHSAEHPVVFENDGFGNSRNFTVLLDHNAFSRITRWHCNHMLDPKLAAVSRGTRYAATKEYFQFQYTTCGY